MKRIINGLFNENPIFVLTLGLCSSLAVTKNVESAYLMGLCLTLVLISSNVIISSVKKIVPNNVRIPAYILIIGTFVTIVEILLSRFIPALYSSFGIYLPLIVVNCIVLGRALSVASKETVGASFLDGIGIGLGYTLAITLIALFREVLGANTITLINNLKVFTNNQTLIISNIFPNSSIFPISIFANEAGAFITLGLLMALFEGIKQRRKHESN